MSTALACQALSKRYGSHDALVAVSFECQAGEAVGILGPNGAGKSTLINVSLGLLEASQGLVLLGGHPPRAAVRLGKVGVMLQRSHLPDDATPKELIRFQRALHPEPLGLGTIIETSGIGDFYRRRIDRLSGGQVRRVEFAMAIAGNPEILFLDEPTEGMDLESRQEFWLRLGQLKQQGTAIIFSSHDLNETDRYADRILLLARGQRVAFDTAQQLKASMALPRIRFKLRTPSNVASLSHALRCRVELSGTDFLAYTDDSDGTLRAVVALEQHAYQMGIEESGLDEVFTELTRTQKGGQER